ncbi:hypothetical protein EVAR_100208_1 [Eumeta japonica]|uniref:Uncharacterized protein n=1 Tax=Eumeta variegata TaxID=151549 RepID=A0A4C1ZL44_EUMVA|nr:hypothetical protein EVAR_100208_1 [Eumeta japonica]
MLVCRPDDSGAPSVRRHDIGPWIFMRRIYDLVKIVDRHFSERRRRRVSHPFYVAKDVRRAGAVDLATSSSRAAGPWPKPQRLPLDPDLIPELRRVA